jgi:hypothetical protein
VRKSKNLLVIFAVILALNLFFLSYARAEDPAPAITTIVTPGGDDVSYQIPLSVTIVYDGVNYQNVYATTNSVITFGRPDGTYWDYPLTPSISIESKDWWVLPQQMPDTHFIISVSEGGFQVDGTYRPYGTFSGDTTNIVITAQIQTDGTVAYTYATSGPLSGNERTGARLVDGTIVTLEEAGVTEVEVPPVLEPTPVEPEPEPTPEPPAPPTPEPVAPPIFIDYQPALEVAPEPPAVVEEPPAVVEEPPAEVEEPPAVVEEPPAEVEEAPTPVEEPPAEAEAPPVEPEVTQADEVDLETLAPETPVQLDNGVVLEAGTVVALQLLENPAELLAEIFTNPAQVFTALSNIGADMSDEERTTSQNTIIASVIAGQAAINAVGAATMARTATPTPTPSGGGAPSANDNIKLYKRRKP